MGEEAADARVAYFTAGTIGVGHVVRGLAIKRALHRAGALVDYRIFAPASLLGGEAVTTVAISARELRKPALAYESRLGQALRGFAPHLVLVDLFWAPVRHILPVAQWPAWLLVRSCPPTWFGSLAGFTFDAAHYERVIAIEPIAPREIIDRIDPVVMANPSECRPASALRDRLGVTRAERLEVTLSGEQPGSFQRSGREVKVRLNWSSGLFPSCEWLSGADSIIAAAGYNAYWESVWLGHRTRTTFHAEPRPIDNQAARITAPERHMRVNGADTLATEIVNRLKEER